MAEQKLLEAITAFDSIGKKPEMVRDFNKWQPSSKTKTGQKSILRAALKGDATAVNFLFVRLLGMISDVFWTNFLGPNPKMQKIRINNNDDILFIGEVFNLLLSKDTNPLKTFNPDLYDNDPKVDLITMFGHNYLKPYLKAEAIRINKERKAAGMTGVGNTDTVGDLTSSFDDAFENSDEAAALDSFTSDVEIKESFKVFLKILKKDDELGYKLMLAKILNKGFSEMTKELGVSETAWRNKLKALQQDWLRFIGEI